MKKKIIQAQAQLMQRASILMVAGYDSKVYASCHPYCNLFTFAFADIDLCFDDENPFNDADIDKAIAKLDAMIEEMQHKAEFTIDVIKAWRG
jgi:hypothetical protein